MNILVVDDEPAILAALQTILKMDGHVVCSASLPYEAVEKVRAADSPFGLVITDQTMPGMSGPELACALKAISPSTSIALLTGALRTDGAHLPQGIDYILQKPIRLADLRKFMRDLTQRVAAETDTL